MPIINNVKNSISIAAEVISDVSQNIIEKNRLNAQLNRLRLLIKNENAVLKNAYSELGKYFYKLKTIEIFDEKDINYLFEIIKSSNEKIENAKARYNLLMQIKLDESYKVSGHVDLDETIEDLETDAQEILKSLQKKTKEAKNKGKEVIEKAKETTELIKEKSAPVVEKLADTSYTAVKVMRVKGSVLAENTKEKSKDVFEKIAKAAEAVKEKSAPVAEKIAESSNNAVNILQIKGEEFSEIAKEKGTEVIDQAKDVAETVKEKSAPVTEKIAEVSANVAEFAKDTAINTATSVKNLYNETKEFINKKTSDELKNETAAPVHISSPHEGFIFTEEIEEADDNDAF